MTELDKQTAARLRFLIARAQRAGYQLIAEPTGDGWVLVDIHDGQRLFESGSLAGVEQYLNE
ncbi:hypothetical protein GV792_17340 [Nocardia cyriacigeorgica]|uniref:Uncharacterized protein n=1 Tax=Nocardia cyriacigeorgica TaxID=135487 RepID=A0A6P1D9T9_9NOCA|nr:hypothetical protein [Nocardia cyriacigeorgica]NEW40206.1 hypothetical protein [Nocardia cyriacigeorgica]NEW47257.1 hypothetical protein [Nocardia cyriacigeorgica]NEW51807.1 hypothetical protein [Nocardia cyriacigeorgica]